MNPLIRACRLPWAGLLVQSDGKVPFCCNNGILLGNLNEQSFDEVWNGAPAGHEHLGSCTVTGLAP